MRNAGICSCISAVTVSNDYYGGTGCRHTLHSLHFPPEMSQRPRQPLGKLLQENILGLDVVVSWQGPEALLRC